MDNLLSFKQKINKRHIKPSEKTKTGYYSPLLTRKPEQFSLGNRVSLKDMLKGQSTGRQSTGQMSTGLMSAGQKIFPGISGKKKSVNRKTKEFSYKPLSSSYKTADKRIFKKSVKGQYLILPALFVNHITKLFNKSSENRIFKNQIINIVRRFPFGNVFINTFTAALIFGIIITASISSSAFVPPAEINLPRDNRVDSMMEAVLSKEDTADAKAFGNVDLSLLKGFKIREHRIVSGESLSTIANKYNIDLGTIISFNNIKNARKINSGTTIKIPDKTGLFYKVTKGDSLGSIAAKFNVELNSLLDINNIDSYLIKPGQELFIPGAKMNSFDLKKALGELFLYPVSGRLTSPYGYRKDPFTGRRMMHYGMDISNYPGTKVRATLDGKVLMCSYSSIYGKFVIIKHQDNYQSLYAHLDKYRVREGENVVQGQIIGELGNTGRSTGPHLHFSIYHNQKPIDPATVLSASR